ncbi:MAG: aldo/keto reductase [Flavobacteriaceae bacterium]
MKESRFIWGHWRLLDWNLSTKELELLSNQAIDLGITSFDHADIYGDYQCEEAFGKVLKQNPEMRNKIELISKCGIKLLSDKFPDRKTKYYDYSKDYIINQVNQSLKNLSTDRLDVLLLHRPSPFMDADEVAEAFDFLFEQGKVKSFGVSNFLPIEFEQLQNACNHKLISNQIEISVACLEHFDNNNINFLQTKGISPMAWSPLSGGDLFNQTNDLTQLLDNLKEKYNASGIDQIAYAWLLKHPSGIRPILGSGKLSRLKDAVDSLNINLSLEDWFAIYQASKGHEVA